VQRRVFDRFALLAVSSLSNHARASASVARLLFFGDEVPLPDFALVRSSSASAANSSGATIIRAVAGACPVIVKKRPRVIH